MALSVIRPGEPKGPLQQLWCGRGICCAVGKEGFTVEYLQWVWRWPHHNSRNIWISLWYFLQFRNKNVSSKRAVWSSLSVFQAYKWYELGHQRGHFASVWQRSLYNVNGLKAQPWWTPRETGYTELVKVSVSSAAAHSTCFLLKPHVVEGMLEKRCFLSFFFVCLFF